MTCRLPKLPDPSVFSYQAIVSSTPEAERTSTSPSPSRSAAKTDWAPSAAVVITCWSPKLPDPSVFSYQAILSSSLDAESTSRSPSPSTSAAKTDTAPSAAVVITCWSPKLPDPSVFSYQAILSSPYEAESTSRSPSPSTSAAKTELATSVSEEIAVCSKNAALRWMVRFSYHAISLSGIEVERTSRSPSPSTSAAVTEVNETVAAEITCGLAKLPAPSVFSHDQISLPAAARTSRSPSPSRSTAKTESGADAAVEITCWPPKLPAPSVFSYQAIRLSFDDAERTSTSPSPSTSAAKTDWAPPAAVEMTC